MYRPIFFSDDSDAIADLELVQVDAVVVDDGRPVVHHPVAGHHPERSGRFGVRKVFI